MVCRCPDPGLSERGYRQGSWFVVETANFLVYCDESDARAKSLARHAETLRTTFSKKWLGDTSLESWSPRCQIVLHSTQRSYVAAAGRGSERTVGSSLVKANGRKILSRRIDLLAGKSGFVSPALPHELTHVILKEKFAPTPIPRWADEGIAILADPSDKQERHKTDLRKAIVNGATFRAAALLTLEDYPPPERFAVFYGQSASLAEFLVTRRTPEEFINFIERANVVGYDSALRSCYDIANVRELDRKWRDFALSYFSIDRAL
jgi:hypothetical protein